MGLPQEEERCLFPLPAIQVTVKGESPSHTALEPGRWPQETWSQPAVSVLSRMGSTIRFQLSRLLFLLRAEIWVTNAFWQVFILRHYCEDCLGRGGGEVGQGN